ncbi:MAG: hypothetical protein LBD62_05090 [Candidatus Margulisbacteria bacterium]|jgi:hypothetical protein|nr:hypothetical protein [Candidatus Margulisiibacteriota bacterium]
MKKITLLFMLLIWLVGCGRIVTDKTITDSSGNVVDIREVEFTFTFAGTPATDSGYKYYLIITTQNINGGDGLRLLEATDGALTYFASPDDTNISSQNLSALTQYYNYSVGADYNEVLGLVYEQYFTKWAQYFVYNNTGQFLMRYGSGGGFSPADQGQLTPQPAQPVSRAGNQLRWNIPLAALGNDFYFALLTVYDTANPPRHLMDGIGLEFVGLNSANKVTDDDKVSDRSGIPSGLNITNYNVQIREY